MINWDGLVNEEKENMWLQYSRLRATLCMSPQEFDQYGEYILIKEALEDWEESNARMEYFEYLDQHGLKHNENGR